MNLPCLALSFEPCFLPIFGADVFRYKENGTYIYHAQAVELRHSARNTLFVNCDHLDAFNAELAPAIQKEYYRLYPSLCQAVKNFAVDQCDKLVASNPTEEKFPLKKDVYLSLTNHRLKNRHLLLFFIMLLNGLF